MSLTFSNPPFCLPIMPPSPSNFAATSLTIYPTTRRSVDALELSDALGLACIQGGASKRSRMEEQVFGKMSALSLSLDISNDGTGRGKLRGSGPASGTRGNKKRGDGTVHVKLDLGAMNLVGGVGAHVPGRGRVNTQVPREHLAQGIWKTIHGSVDSVEPWSLEIRRATPETVHGLETAVGPSGPSLDFTDFQALAGRMKHLVSLSLRSGRGVGDEGAKALARALHDAVPCLKTLNLSGNNLGPEAAAAIAGALMKVQDEPLSMPQLASGCALEELDLSGNHIGSDGACSLAGALVEVGCPRLKKLDLTHNVIGPRGAAAVAEIFLGQALRGEGDGNHSAHRRHCYQRGYALEELNLRHNGIGDSGANAIASAITEAARLRAKTSGPLMSGQSSFVSPAGLLDDARYEPHCLRALRLGFNGISAVGAHSLSEALNAAVRAARLSLGDDAARDAPCVRELDLACNSIGPDGAKTLAKALDGLEELDLGNNGIGDGGIKWLAKALKENTTLRKLIVSGNNVTAEGTFWVAESLSTNQDLRHLDLGSNEIGDAGAKDIAEDLRDNTGLHSLILRRNGIGDEGALELCNALDPIAGDMHQKTNAYLTELSLRGNRISDKAAIEVKRRVGLRMDVELQQRY